jgi:D-alanine-D-alanine ligase
LPLRHSILIPLRHNKGWIMKKVVIVFGGRSSEHEVSLNSAKNIYKALDKKKYMGLLVGVSKEGTWYLLEEKTFLSKAALLDSEMNQETPISLVSFQGQKSIVNMKNFERTSFDCIFPIIHGTNGEDGSLQGYFKILNAPFVGCGVLSSAVCMDKEFMKVVLSEKGIANSKYVVVRKEKPETYEQLSKELGSPFFIKPANAGSSVGVHKIKSAEDYNKKITDTFLYDYKIIAEEFIQGREIECSVMGLNHDAKPATPGELNVKHEFYSYEAKYLDENGAEIIIPANLTTQKTEEIRSLAKKAYEALGCDGMARVDFFMKANGDLIVNELNTLPGFTKISMYPKMWEAHGLPYSELISELIELAFTKYDREAKIKLTF